MGCGLKRNPQQESDSKDFWGSINPSVPPPPLRSSGPHCPVGLLLSHPQQKAKNEELIQLAEQRKREAERKKKEVEEQENATLRRQYERERRARVEEVCLFSRPLAVCSLGYRFGVESTTNRYRAGVADTCTTLINTFLFK